MKDLKANFQIWEERKYMLWMANRTRGRHQLWGSALWLIVIFVSANAIPQSADVEPSRRFWPPGYRPATSSAKPKAAKYRRVTPPLTKTESLAAEAGEAVLGVTIWRLRPAQATDAARILVTKSGRKTDYTPERVEASTAFNEGQLVRLSVEVPRNGYLYVINREQYADSTFSDPYLIFPLQSQHGENRVSAGRVVELPPQMDEQAVFELHSVRGEGKAAQVAEVLTFLISPTPLTGLPQLNADDSPLKLSPVLVEDWEKRWSANVEQLELVQGAGTAYTHAEQRAGLSAKQRLTPADPLPQTIFRVGTKRGSPFVVKMPLKISQ
ncbi:MAG: DUF4384 domain-containing protein [Blastocatellia bacterium]